MTRVRTDVVEALSRHRLLGILRYPDGGPVALAVRALARGGVALAEITIDTPGAIDTVEVAAADGACVGVGTVTTAGQVADCAAAGAQFVVSPGLVPEVVTACLRAGLEPLPGVTTATEVIAARDLGARMLKLFPAAALGPAYLAALRGPFPDVAFVATGGVGVDAIGEFLDAGAAAVALGSDLVGRHAPETEEELQVIARRAAAAVAAAVPTDGHVRPPASAAQVRASRA